MKLKEGKDKGKMRNEKKGRRGSGKRKCEERNEFETKMHDSCHVATSRRTDSSFQDSSVYARSFVRRGAIGAHARWGRSLGNDVHHFKEVPKFSI